MYLQSIQYVSEEIVLYMNFIPPWKDFQAQINLILFKWFLNLSIKLLNIN